MSQKVKKNIPTVAMFIMAAALFVSFAKIHSLESDVQTLRRTQNNEISMLRSDIAAIYSDVEDKLREQTSLLSSIDAQYGEVNLDDHTIDVTVRLVPKLISDNMKLKLSINGRSADLIKNNETFTGVIAVNLFNDEEQLLLTIESDAGIKTQYLTEIQTQDLWINRIPSLYYCDISGKHFFGQGKYILIGTLDINFTPIEETPDIRFNKFVLVTELNGSEIGREDITSDVLNHQHYPDGLYFRDDYHLECNAAEGDELIVRLEATDTMGYVHKMLLHSWKERHGAAAEAIRDGEFIYDAAGNLIYGKQ